MKIHKCKVILAVCVILSFSSFAYAEQNLTIKGYSYSIVKPNIAHIILKITGEGNDYAESETIADNNLKEVIALAKAHFNADISPAIIKVKNKVKSQLDNGDYSDYTQEYFKQMASAMKGEEIEVLKSKKENVYATTKFIYFSMNDYSVKAIDAFRNALVNAKLAFSEKVTFDYMSSFELNKSYIIYGMKDHYGQLENMTRDAYSNALLKARHTVNAVGSTLGKLISIEKGCKEIEGTVDISEMNKLLGKNLGPVSSDPLAIPLEYNVKFVFSIN